MIFLHYNQMLRYTIFIISSVNILSSLQTIYFLPDIWPALSKIRQYSLLFFNTLSFVCDTDYFKNEIIFNKENSCIFPIGIVSLRYGEIFGYTIFIIPSTHTFYTLSPNYLPSLRRPSCIF